MNPSPIPPTDYGSHRPSRLSKATRYTLAILFLASFFTGVLIWIGQSMLTAETATPAWLHLSLVAHGCLNPFLCAMFGWLLRQHVRIGWHLKANLPTGMFLEGCFAGLILTGVGLYYAGPDVREPIVWMHRLLGIAFPAALWIHWAAGLKWASKLRSGQP